MSTEFSSLTCGAGFMPAPLVLRSRLVVRWHELHLVALEEPAGGMIDAGHGGLVAGLCLYQRQFRLRELRLRIEDEEDCRGTQLIFSLFDLQAFLGQVSGDLGGFQSVWIVRASARCWSHPD
jgi:hypothetical protein